MSSAAARAVVLYRQEKRYKDIFISNTPFVQADCRAENRTEASSFLSGRTDIGTTSGKVAPIGATFGSRDPIAGIPTGKASLWPKLVHCRPLEGPLQAVPILRWVNPPGVCPSLTPANLLLRPISPTWSIVTRGVSDSQICFADTRIGDQFLGGSAEADAAGLHDIAAIGDPQGCVGVLLDQQYGDAERF